MNEAPPLLRSVRKSWIERHFGWFIAGVFAAGLIALGGVVALILALAFGGMRSSTPYSQAMERVRADREVRAVLGAPIHERWFMTGNIDFSGSGGHAEFEIPVTAPKGKGVVYVLARRSSGVWRLTLLVVDIPAANERIDLLRRGRQTPLRPPPAQHPPSKRGVPAGGVEI